MHKKEKLDFYHGLALKRHQLFAISYLAGLFLFLIPYIVCTVLTILVGAVKGIMTLSLAGECFLTMGTGILAFLLIYHTCIFAGMLTGRSVTMFLGTLVIGVYPSLVLTLLPSLRDAFSRQLITYTTVYLKNFRNIFRHFRCSSACLNKIILTRMCL